MPVLDDRHWVGKLGKPNPCHYGDWWLDTYADIVRKAAVRRIFPGRHLRVLDVGCGDGRFGAWIQRAFGCRVCGVDAFRWPGAADRLDAFSVCDAEALELHPPMAFDVAICVTSLPFMRDWRKAVERLCSTIPMVLVVENLQTPAPPWQHGLAEKTPIEYATLLHEFSRNGFAPIAETCVNVLDRRLFLSRLPTPIAFMVTLFIDLCAGYLQDPRKGRYAAILFRRGGPWHNR